MWSPAVVLFFFSWRTPRGREKTASCAPYHACHMSIPLHTFMSTEQRDGGMFCRVWQPKLNKPRSLLCSPLLSSPLLACPVLVETLTLADGLPYPCRATPFISSCWIGVTEYLVVPLQSVNKASAQTPNPNLLPRLGRCVNSFNPSVAGSWRRS